MRPYPYAHRAFSWLALILAAATLGVAFVSWGLPQLVSEGQLQIHYSEGSH